MSLTKEKTRKILDDCAREFARGNDFIKHVNDHVGTPKWALCQKLTPAMEKRGFEYAVTQELFCALRLEFGLPLFFAAVAWYAKEHGAAGG